jgi:DeoR family fructose operon transcriptional repressor
MQEQPLQKKPDDFPLTITCDCGNDLTELRFRWKARKSLVDIGKYEILQVQVLICDDCGEEVLIDEKNRIAKAALAEVPQAGAIILDSGTTTSRLIQLIPDDRELTVITDSVAHALSLANRINVTVMLIGGRVRGKTLATVDQWALDALKNVYADVALLGTNGISIERGLTTPDQPEAAVKRAMLNSAKRKVILADHTKFGDDHFASFGDLTDIDVVITDRGVDQNYAEKIELLDVKVVQA